MHSVIRSFPLDAASQLPQSETFSRSIRRQCQVPPANSNNQLPDHLKQTVGAEKFLLHEDKELIIFTTESNLSVLRACQHWFADGTSKQDKGREFLIYSLSHCYRSARANTVSHLVASTWFFFSAAGAKFAQSTK